MVLHREYDVEANRSIRVSASVWNLKTQEAIATDLRHVDPTAAIIATLFVPDSGDAITLSQDGTAVRWDGDNGEKLMTYQGVPWNAKSAALTGEQNQLIVRCHNGSFKLWDLQTAQPHLADTVTCFTTPAAGSPSQLMDRRAGIWSMSAGACHESRALGIVRMTVRHFHF